MRFKNILFCIYFILTVPTICYTQIAPPTASHPGGFYDDSFMLELKSEYPEAEIFYTLDGTSPLTDGIKYTGPIEIKDRTDEHNVWSMIKTSTPRFDWGQPTEKIQKANTLQAIAKSNGETSNIFRQSYFSTSSNKHDLPVVSLITDAASLFDENSGIYVPGVDHDDDYLYSGNYYRRGREHEIVSKLEFFDESGDLVLNQEIGVRIHGGYSRLYPLKGLRLYSRNEYGTSRDRKSVV